MSKSFIDSNIWLEKGERREWPNGIGPGAVKRNPQNPFLG